MPLSPSPAVPREAASGPQARGLPTSPAEAAAGRRIRDLEQAGVLELCSTTLTIEEKSEIELPSSSWFGMRWTAVISSVAVTA